MFIAALFIIVKIWEQPKCLSMDEENVAHIYNGIRFNQKKKILPLATRWMEHYAKGNKSDGKDKYCMISLIYGI